MQRFLLLFLFCSPISFYAQSINWISPCTDKTFCLDPGSCTEGSVFLVEEAVTSCQNSKINYTYRVDLFSNGTIDIVSSEDTVDQVFPAGAHIIYWRANDNCGNVSTDCSYQFTVKDCFPPNLLCINGLTQNLEYPECEASFHYEDFILNVSDNCTPTADLDFGIRKAGNGPGFPEDTTLTFGICEQGLHILEILVRDENGLTNQCNSYVLVQENNGLCECNISANITLEGCAHAPDSSKLETYMVRSSLEATPLQGQPFTKTLHNNFQDSCFNLSYLDLPLNGAYTGKIWANRLGDPLIGVSTFDLVVINRHILGQEPLKNFYQVLASDANQSQSISTFDIIEIRKLILGIYDTLPNAPAWRFIQPLADPLDLTGYSAVRDTYSFSIGNLMEDTTLTRFDFIGVKIGDANSNALFNDPDPDDRTSREPMWLETPDRMLQAGTTFWVPVHATAAAYLQGWQLALHTDPDRLRILDIRGVPPAFAALHEDALRISCIYDQPRSVEPEEPLFYVLVTALEDVQLSEALYLRSADLLPEAYTGEEPVSRPVMFRIGVQGEGTVHILPPQPNPFTDKTVIGIELSVPAPVHLEVFSLTGKRVYQVSGELAAGSQSLTIPANALPGAGVWLYRVQAGSVVSSGRIVRL
ncbi:MAG: T9SS type A sorting domain-containing protein [Bacteroidetes bacterium]|nr:MAG: T9SS type A sorting domain-containing protein [Bacteroidota bacterium]